MARRLSSPKAARHEGGSDSILLRKTDGSPAVRLGEGGFGRLSPDGQWVACLLGSPRKLMLLPTGVGEPRQLTDDQNDHGSAAWLPDSKSIVFSANEPGHGPRMYVKDIQGGTPRVLTPEGTAGTLITPDGKYLVAHDVNRQVWLYPIAGGDPQEINFTAGPNEFAVGFSGDGKGLLVEASGVPMKISLVDLATGRRVPFKEIAPADPAGVQSIPNIRFSADGKAYAYSTLRVLSDLYVVDGMK
jgi:dipeptidyl aminopeptidase/acylaminoacyl peptidase